ncbi:protein CASPARIAN STRIP INTEGRITY FACTOR 1-like isoform X1 [Phragmites australis]|uniref:protein CASPARIAN STRIP INTEGRITY FACTOR 1-like isoform X1 n=1 Tax=Phragmites australis TaxID=29695 RepID=UPI002D79E9DD|nr:protein CASPARIAN STRIP INTEGRITY FACTOR 1-like isoform X1 [Phragmites australis]
MRMLPWPLRSAALFALIFFAVLFSTTFAGRQCCFLTYQDALRQQREVWSRKNILAFQNNPFFSPIAEAEQKEAVPRVHPRMLNVKTNDYGSYDPSPSMDKPHFKLIPN